MIDHIVHSEFAAVTDIPTHNKQYVDRAYRFFGKNLQLRMLLELSCDPSEKIFMDFDFPVFDELKAEH
eukprot:1813080-Pleurochrysis_carterae.AAC.1